MNIVNDSVMHTENHLSVMKTCLLTAVEEVVGFGGRVQPCWLKIVLKFSFH